MSFLFNRQDDNFENLERDMETVLKVVDRFMEKSIHMSVKTAKAVIRGINEISDYYELTEEEADRKRKRKEQHTKIFRSEQEDELYK